MMMSKNGYSAKLEWSQLMVETTIRTCLRTDITAQLKIKNGLNEVRTLRGNLPRPLLLETWAYNPTLLTEQERKRISVLAEGFWEKLGGWTKAGAKKAADAVASGAKAAASGVKKLGGKAVEFAKKFVDKSGEIFLWVLVKVAGQDIADAVMELGGLIKDKVKEAAAWCKETLNGFMDTAKKKFIDIFSELIFKNDEGLRSDLYKAFGVSEEQVDQAIQEMKKLKITTLSELNIHLAANQIVLLEAQGGDAAEDMTVQDAAKSLGTAKDEAEQMAKVLGFMENPPEGDPGNINPMEYARGKLADVVDKMFEVYGKLVDANPIKFATPLFKAGFLKVFNTGFGQFCGAIVKILSSDNVSLDLVKECIMKIYTGLKKGTGKIKDAGGYLFGANKGEGLKNFLTGIIKGSNAELIVRVVGGDVGAMAKGTTRIIKLLWELCKEGIGKFKKQIVQDVLDTEEYGEQEDKAFEELEGGLGKELESLFAA
tara:strand:- start:813 stop:2264 length:1452 start_codon:yes stop_codon:yes gene_type:complete